MADIFDKAQATTADQEGDGIYLGINRTTTPLDRWIKPGDFFKSRTGNYSVLSYASLSAAVTAIGATQVTLEIPVSCAVTADLTVPSNITLLLLGSGGFNTSVTKTLTINGPLVAPLRQIFTGSGSVKLGSRIGVAYPEWFGAVSDNSTDDQPAIQAAINAFKGSSVQHHPAIVHLTGGYAVGSTILISGNSVTLRSQGWGEQNTTPYRGFIRALDGCEGLPVVLVTECWNTSIEQIRIIGNSAHPPSAGIELRSQNIAHGLDFSFIRNVTIGAVFGYDTDSSANQFDVGLLISGGVDGDTNYFQNVQLVRCAIGVDLQNHNAGVTIYDNFLFSLCDVGFKCAAPVVGRNWNFGANALDIELVDLLGVLRLTDVTSEGAVKFASMGTATELYIDHLGFQVSNTLNGSGLIIEASGSGAKLVLRNALFQTIGGYTGATPKLLVRNTSGGSQNYIRLENVRGLYQGNLDFQTIGGGAQDIREVFYHRPPNGNNDFGVNDHFWLTNSGGYAEGTNDFASKLNVYGGPFTVKKLTTPTGLAVTAVGGTGTTRGYRVSAISGSGETLACSTVTVSGPSSLDSTHYTILHWDPVLGADGYRIYGRTSGSELLMATVRPSDGTNADAGQLTSFIDTGSITPSGALPTGNTTGRIVTEALWNGLKGADVASAATIVPTGNYFIVTGTTNITAISSAGLAPGTEITMAFSNACTVVDDNSLLNLAGNFTSSQDDTLTLVWWGDAWREKCRSVN